MHVFDAIALLKQGMDESASTQSDSPWMSAASKAGLVSQGDKGNMGIDEDYIAAFGQVELRLKYTWRDTSKTFSPGPDRTRLKLDLVSNSNIVASYTAGYEK